MPGNEAYKKTPELRDVFPQRQEITQLRTQLRDSVENNPNQDIMTLAKIDESLPPKMQEEPLKLMKDQLSSLVGRLISKGVDIEILKREPSLITKLLEVNAIQLWPDELEAMEQWIRLKSSQGQTADYVRSRAFWTEAVNGATFFSRSYRTVEDYAKENPKTFWILFSVAVGLGLRRGYKTLKKAESGKEDKKSGKWGKRFKWVLGGMALAGVAGLIFRDKTIPFLKESLKEKDIELLDEEIQQMKDSMQFFRDVSKELRQKLGQCEWGRQWLKNLDQEIAEHHPELLAQNSEVSSEALENPDGSDTVLIGESIMHGCYLSDAWAKKPDLVGTSNIHVDEVVRRVESPEGRRKIRGKKRALIYMGGNDVGDTEKILAAMKRVGQVCQEEGVECVFATRLPIDPRYRKILGEEKYATRYKKSAELREAVIQAYQAGEFPQGTELVDLYAELGTPNGELKPVFVKGGPKNVEGITTTKQLPPQEANNLTHPSAAYVAMMNRMRSAGRQARGDSARVA